MTNKEEVIINYINLKLKIRNLKYAQNVNLRSFSVQIIYVFSAKILITRFITLR